MAFDKAKTLQAAEKNLELGKIPAAIKEYAKIVENDPDDFTTLNMLGDLHVRVGQKEAAISNFARIAEHYHQQDFVLKAIAMYKKIDRLRPNDTETAHTLARLYAQQDLVVEARAHYLLVAEAYSRANETQKALEILRKIAGLDPQNTDIRIKLADAYLKEGMKQEAATVFAEAGERLLATGAFERALGLYGKCLEIDPTNLNALRGLLATHGERGTPDEAAELIAQASANDPDSAELLSMLVAAYVESEDPLAAERATTALVKKDSFAYLKFVDVARLYLKSDKIDDAVRVIDAIAQSMLAGGQGDQLLQLINEVLVVDADNVRALHLLISVYWHRRERTELISSLERLADASQAAGLEHDERFALTQLARLSPNDRYVSRLNDLGGPAEDAAAKALPAFDANPETIVFSEDQSVSISEPQFHQADNSTVSPDQTEESATDWAMSQSDAGSEFEIGFDAIHQQAQVESSQPDGPATSVDDQRSEARARELESVDFYIAQGYVDIAVDTLNLLESQFGPHPDIEDRREQIRSTLDSPAAGEDVPTCAIEESTVPETKFPGRVKAPFEIAATPPVSSNGSPAPAQSASGPIDPGLAEIFEEFRISEEADANANGDYETHYNLGLAYKEMDLLEEAVEEFQIAVGLAAPSDGTPRYLQCCNLLGHCFMQKKVPRLAVSWFNRGLTAPGHSQEEYQALRFDLGLAYEQIGEIDRALEIFTEIYGTNISYRGVKEKLHELQARI